MSTWWTRDAIDATAPEQLSPPRLARGERADILAQLEARIGAFTPEWLQRTPGDAGDALLHLYSELAEPIIQRLNRLPDKAAREFLSSAGARVAPAKPARVTLNFTVGQAAPRSVLVPSGFQVTASATDGSGQRVVFETERTLYAAPGDIALCMVQDGARYYAVDLTRGDLSTAVPAFGSEPRVGSALLLGLSAAVAPAPNLTFGFQQTVGQGPPATVAAGGLGASPPVALPILRWSFFDGGAFEPAEVVRDDTRGLTQSGEVELRCPREWRAGNPSGIVSKRALRWVRVQLAAGEFATPPLLAFVQLNAVSAIAARTIRNEVLEYVPGGEGRRLRLSQGPVRAGSLELSVAEGSLSAAQQRWSRVDSLAAYGPDDRVFELDEVSREVQFGDGIHGAVLPEGFRHVVAERYEIATGAAGSVAAEQITNLLSSAPFLTKVSNRLPAVGGRDAETVAAATAIAPQRIRAREQAVTAADYALLALAAPGADVLRAHAAAGIHAGLGAAQVPGTVSVYLVGARRANGPPYPDAASLRSVAEWLTREVAPAGVEVVAAAPYFHQISVRATLVAGEGADWGDVLRGTLRELDAFLDPLTGGLDHEGWPFGGVLDHHVLSQHLIASVPGLLAVSALNLTVDGEALAACTSFTPRPHSLLWPVPHDLRLTAEAAR